MEELFKKYSSNSEYLTIDKFCNFLKEEQKVFIIIIYLIFFQRNRKPILQLTLVNSL